MRWLSDRALKGGRHRLAVLQLLGAAGIIAIATAAGDVGGSTATPAPAPKQTNAASLERFAHGQLFRILGKDVRGTSGAVIGRVVDLLVDANGQPRAALIDFGGFLGVGSRKIAIDWGALHFSPAESPDVLVDLDRDQIKAAPEYKDTEQAVAVVGPPQEQEGE